jgi:hypothetical protein
MKKKFVVIGFASALLVVVTVTAFADKDVTLKPGFYTAGDSSLGVWNIIYIGDRYSDDTCVVSLYSTASDGRGPKNTYWEGKGVYVDGYKINVDGTDMGRRLVFTLEVYSGTAIRYKGKIYRLMS